MWMPQKPPFNWTAYVTCNAKIWFNRFYFSFCTVAVFMDVAFFHANRNCSAKIWKKTVKRQNNDKILWIICGVLKQYAQQQKVRYRCENAFDVPFRFAMKSINFKCLTTAISVDWWSERTGEKGSNALCWKPKHQIINGKNHVWSMKTAHNSSVEEWIATTKNDNKTNIACRWQQRCINSNMHRSNMNESKRKL